MMNEQLKITIQAAKAFAKIVDNSTAKNVPEELIVKMCKKYGVKESHIRKIGHWELCQNCKSKKKGWYLIYLIVVLNASIIMEHLPRTNNCTNPDNESISKRKSIDQGTYMYKLGKDAGKLIGENIAYKEIINWIEIGEHSTETILRLLKIKVL